MAILPENWQNDGDILNVVGVEWLKHPRAGMVVGMDKAVRRAVDDTWIRRPHCPAAVLIFPLAVAPVTHAIEALRAAGRAARASAEYHRVGIPCLSQRLRCAEWHAPELV
jgi:hypothetical protein